MDTMVFEKYGIYDVKLPPAKGSVQTGFRPVIIIQNNVANKYSPTVLIIPLTTKIKHTNQATHTLIEDYEKYGLDEVSMVLGESPLTIDKELVKRKRGKIDDRETQKRVFRCFINAAAYGYDDIDAQEITY